MFFLLFSNKIYKKIIKKLCCNGHHRAPRGWKRHGGASCPRGVECPGCEDGRMLVDVYISSHIENRCVQNVMYTQIVKKKIERED